MPAEEFRALPFLATRFLQTAKEARRFHAQDIGKKLHVSKLEAQDRSVSLGVRDQILAEPPTTCTLRSRPNAAHRKANHIPSLWHADSWALNVTPGFRCRNYKARYEDNDSDSSCTLDGAIPFAGTRIGKRLSTGHRESFFLKLALRQLGEDATRNVMVEAFDNPHLVRVHFDVPLSILGENALGTSG